MTDPVPGDLEPVRLRGLGVGRWLGRSLEVRGRTGSTMDDARRAAGAGAPEGHLVVADRQDAGRGARGRAWSSPGGTDLYLSFLVHPEHIAPRALPSATLAVGLGVADAVDEVLGAPRTRIRWPNDVLVLGDRVDEARKCAGVLVETVSTGTRVDALVVGIGLDVNRPAFEPPLEALATSLWIAAGRPQPALDRGAVLATLARALEARIDAFRQGGPAVVAQALEGRLAYRDVPVKVEGDPEPARIAGIDDDGALLVTPLAGGAGRRVTAGRVRPVGHPEAS